MRWTICQVMALGLFITLGLTGGVWAAEARICDARMAIFPTAEQTNVSIRVFVAVSGKDAKVQVRGSGTWNGTHTRSRNGSATVVFDTGGAIETLTVGASGELHWEIAYKNAPAADKRVMFFLGKCGPWKAK